MTIHIVVLCMKLRLVKELILLHNGNALYRASVWPNGTNPHSPAPRAPTASCLVLLSPRVALHRTSRTAELRTPCRSIELRASVKLCINERLLGAASRWAHVATICFMCFRCMLHIFHLDVAKVDLVLHMLQWLYTYVASVCIKCFSCFKCMLQVFYLDVAYVVLGLYTYVASVCFKCFMGFKRML
jgi:hypothetical protein